jgi:hypothetical protein
LTYKVTAIDQNGNSATWEPFNRTTTQLEVVPGAIEIKAQ